MEGNAGRRVSALLAGPSPLHFLALIYEASEQTGSRGGQRAGTELSLEAGDERRPAAGCGPCVGRSRWPRCHCPAVGCEGLPGLKHKPLQGSNAIHRAPSSRDGHAHTHTHTHTQRYTQSTKQQRWTHTHTHTHCLHRELYFFIGCEKITKKQQNLTT